MLIEVKVPALSESVADATLVSWHKKVGEAVRRDENLVDLETDKVTLEIPAPQDGVLAEIVKGDGSKVVSDELIARIDTEAKAAATASQTPAPAKAAEPAAAPAPSAPADLSPAVRKLVAEHKLKPEHIPGTGKGGRITKADVLGYLEGRGEEQPQAVAEVVPVPQPLPAALVGERPEKRVPMSRLRARIAERLKEAQNTAAILTTFNEVNMGPVMALRNKYKDRFAEAHGIKLGLMSFFTRAVVEALKQFPIVNASIDGEDIIYHGYYDIGIAVGSPRGLVVPILRDVDRMGFAEIEQAVNDYGQKARDGKLAMEDLIGGTFTISNGGVYGSMLSTPILNPPQSAILGMHKIQDRPMAENGQVVIRPMMYLALSYDHRIVDGQDAVLFLVAIKQALEDPARMLLEI